MTRLAQLHRRRALVAPLVTVAVLAAVAAALVLPYRYQYDKYRRNIQAVQPRIERMLGLGQSGDALAQRRQAYQAALDGLAFAPDKSGEALHNELSTRVRQAVEGAGMTLATLSAQPARVQDGLERYPVALTVQGTLPQFQSMLAALHQPPRLAVDVAIIRRGNSLSDKADAAQPLYVELTVLAVRRTQI